MTSGGSLGKWFALQDRNDPDLWRQFYHDEWHDYAAELGHEAVLEAMNTALSGSASALGSPTHEIILGALKGSGLC